MTDLTEFQQRACAIGLVRMFRETHFSICTLDAIAKTMDRKEHMAGRDYDALRAVHCVDWADMGPDMTRMVREKCLELLGLPAQTIDIVSESKPEPPQQAEPAQQASGKLKLAFWK